MAGRSGGCDRGRVAYLPSRRVRRDCQRPDRSDLHLAAREGAAAIDGLPRARVARGVGLEQRQRSLRTVGGPHGQHSPVVFAQRQGTGLASHPNGFSHGLTRASPRGSAQPDRNPVGSAPPPTGQAFAA
jgi:hypothetical protein